MDMWCPFTFPLCNTHYSILQWTRKTTCLTTTWISFYSQHTQEAKTVLHKICRALKGLVDLLQPVITACRVHPATSPWCLHSSSASLGCNVSLRGPTWAARSAPAANRSKKSCGLESPLSLHCRLKSLVQTHNATHLPQLPSSTRCLSF